MQYASSLCEPIKWRSAFLGICHCKPKILFSRRLEEGRKVVKCVKWEVRVSQILTKVYLISKLFEILVSLYHLQNKFHGNYLEYLDF